MRDRRPIRKPPNTAASKTASQQPAKSGTGGPAGGAKNSSGNPPPISSSGKKRGPEALGGKWIDFVTRAWIVLEKDDLILETTCLRMSKSGLYLRCLDPIPVGTKVLALLLDKPFVSADYVKTNKFTMKGVVTDLEQEEMMCKVTVQITLGRVDPSSTMDVHKETKYWWTRSWQ